MPKEKKTIGGKIVDRLAKFAGKLEQVERLSDLPKLMTVRTVKLNLRPKSMSADEVKLLREKLCVSQAVFAEFLGVSASTVRDWEQSKNEPSGPACRLMVEMFRDPNTWRKRFLELASGSSVSA
jgi:DNA-binding transcriptional regulator YiaG